MDTNGTVIDAPHRRVTLDEVRAHRDEVNLIAAAHDVSNVRVFGSVARGESNAESDLDLLVDPGPTCGLFALTGFALDVEELLNVFTQVATPNGLKSRVRSNVLAEAVPL